MPYTTIHWIKLEKRLLNDYRFISISEEAQLIYLKFLMLAGETINKIPKNNSVLQQLFRTTLDETNLQLCIDQIKTYFPKFKENKHFYYFKNFNSKHNWVSPRNSQGTPKEVPEKRREDKIRIEKKRIVSPTQEECISYFKEIGFPQSEALKYFDYFSSNGWKVGGKAPMKDWKAAARNWTRRLPPEAKNRGTSSKLEPRQLDRPPTDKEAELIRKSIEGRT